MYKYHFVIVIQTYWIQYKVSGLRHSELQVKSEVTYESIAVETLENVTLS